MIRTIILAATIVACQVAAAVSADMQDYQCTINNVTSSMDWDASVRASVEKTYIGKIFTVSRLTGVLAGALKSSPMAQPIVVDFGSSENAFKSANLVGARQSGGPGTIIETLNISEFVAEPKKPFAYISNDVVYFGQCTHF